MAPTVALHIEWLWCHGTVVPRMTLYIACFCYHGTVTPTMTLYIAFFCYHSIVAPTMTLYIEWLRCGTINCFVYYFPFLPPRHCGTNNRLVYWMTLLPRNCGTNNDPEYCSVLLIDTKNGPLCWTAFYTMLVIDPLFCPAQYIFHLAWILKYCFYWYSFRFPYASMHETRPWSWAAGLRLRQRCVPVYLASVTPMLWCS